MQDLRHRSLLFHLVVNTFRPPFLISYFVLCNHKYFLLLNLTVIVSLYCCVFQHRNLFFRDFCFSVRFDYNFAVSYGNLTVRNIIFLL